MKQSNKSLTNKFQESIKITVLIEIIDQFQHIRDCRRARKHAILFLTDIDDKTARIPGRGFGIDLLEGEAGLIIREGNDLEAQILLEIGQFNFRDANFFFFSSLILSVDYKTK